MINADDLDIEYLSGFLDAVDQLMAEIFQEPVLVAGVHAGSLFGPQKISSAAIAGCVSGFSHLEAFAALGFFEFNAVHQNTSTIQRLGDRGLRRRHKDLKKICERSFALIKNEVDSESDRFKIFSRTLIDQLARVDLDRPENLSNEQMTARASIITCPTCKGRVSRRDSDSQYCSNCKRTFVE